jgi:Recombinase
VISKRTLSLAAIARQINAEGHQDEAGRNFSGSRIRHILSLELYTGIYSNNKSSKPLQSQATANPRSAWVRTQMFKPIIGPRVFFAAQSRIKRHHHHHYTNDELFGILKSLLDKHVRLSQRIISDAKPPGRNIYCERFGSLPKAYRLVGYDDFDEGKYQVRRPRIYTDDDLLSRLKLTYEREGYLSHDLIDSDPDLPSATLYQQRFGSLARAYAEVGWCSNQLEMAQAGRNRRKAGLQKIVAQRQRKRSIGRH